LKSGIQGYLPKNTTRDELVVAIKEIYQGNEYFSKTIADIILKSYVHSARRGKKVSDDKIENLTNREREILHLIVEGLTNNELSEKLNISIRTVETHKTSIMRKLNLNSTVELVKFALKNKIIEL
jgi:two-component system response regulator NreC